LEIKNSDRAGRDRTKPWTFPNFEGVARPDLGMKGPWGILEKNGNERIFFNFFTGSGDFFRGGDIPISI
ncbi:hypothetical protein, partial [Leptospira santarosai]|uniref:hypothetical protein n=1 Tax=Leptospira santarosai TaxID=28183 RepID=UPI001E4D7ECB